jgi:alkylated DNA repair dioxygenase AlkB
LLLEIKEMVESICGSPFNSALLNYYRDNNDSMGMHRDDELELGRKPIIAFLSLGAERALIVKKKIGAKRCRLALSDANFLLMQADTQTNWRHGIEKEKHPRTGRINITFRTIIHRYNMLR